MFEKITIDGKTLVSIEPKQTYVPLFATLGQSYGYWGTESPPSRPHDTDTLSYALDAKHIHLEATIRNPISSRAGSIGFRKDPYLLPIPVILVASIIPTFPTT